MAYSAITKGMLVLLVLEKLEQRNKSIPGTLEKTHQLLSLCRTIEPWIEGTIMVICWR
jgi:hypothetical protein